jgi:protease stability complex PrcB-like protein
VSRLVLRHVARGCLAIVAAVGIAACSSAVAPGAPRVPLPITRFTPRSEAFSSFSGIRTPTRSVVRDSSAWRVTWQQINQPFFPPPPLPTVDFNREMVLLAGMGTQPSGGYELLIERATRDTTGIEVQLRRISPGAGCPVSAVLTQPLDLVRVPFSDQPVRFSERAEVTSCNGR